MKRILILSTMVLLFISTGCKKIPVLEDGSEVVAEYNGIQVTAEDLYQELKYFSGASILVDYMDNIFFNSLYEDTDEIIEQGEEYLSYVKEQYGDSFEEVLISQGLENEDALLEYLIIDIKKELAVIDYLKDNLSDREIEKYYKNEIAGDIQASHILITPTTNDGMTEDEIEKASDDALELAKSLIDKLDDGEDFNALATEYSDDTSSALNGGDLGFFNKGMMVDEFEDATYDLDVDEYASKPVETEYGYHIILVTDKKDKPELDLVENTILDEIVNNMIADDANLKVNTLIKVREANGFIIYDTEVSKDYDKLMDSLLGE